MALTIFSQKSFAVIPEFTPGVFKWQPGARSGKVDIYGRVIT